MMRRRGLVDDGTGTAAFRPAVVVASLVLCAGMVACGDDSSEAASDPVETTTTTEPEYDSVEEEIVGRYVSAWEARFLANSPPDPELSELREYATGDQLDQLISEAEQNRDAGVEMQRRDDPSGFQRVDVEEVSGDAAVVQECRVADDLWVDIETGEVVDDKIETFSVSGAMERIDGDWVVASTMLLQRWEGVAGCALAE